ncbi:MAG: mechanosensitive ion channel [Proteobacteria bacterium]|nr:mechanosensitive ion channel [Pseudomonadota bacterium]
MIDGLIIYFQHLSTFGQATIVLNVLFFLLAGVIFKYIVIPTDDEESNKRRIRWLRYLNLLLLLIYVVDAFINGVGESNQWLSQLSQTGLVLLTSYLFIQFSHAWALFHYGKDKSIDGGDEIVHSRTYKSEMMHILIIAITVIVTILLLVNIWHVTSWLQATGVLGGLLVVLFATKDAWAIDSVHGMILLYNDDLQPGVICRIPEYNILGIIRRISLTQTMFRDLVQKHKIVIPNSKLRNTKIEILNHSGHKSWNDYIEYKIGYATSSKVVESFFDKVWEVVCEKESALNFDKKPKIALIETGDHAIIWRIHYQLDNIYRLKHARFSINRVAFDLQIEFGLALATPVTHQAVSEGLPTMQENSTDSDSQESQENQENH